MALAYATTLRDDRMNRITLAIDAAVGAGVITIYDGTRPATGGAATTALVILPLSDPSFGVSSSGTITANTISPQNAIAAGTATWFRFTDGDTTFVFDGDVSTSGADLNLIIVDLVIGVPVEITSFSDTEGNP